MPYENEIAILKLTLHGKLVGYITGFQDDRNILTFSDEFKNDSKRPTFSLITHPNFPRATKLMSTPWVKNQRLTPTLSNLLPEGAYREYIAQALKVHIDNEFQMLSCLGEDLPGALIATAIEFNEVPEHMVSNIHGAKVVKFKKHFQTNKFSLAGIQMKFSMKEREGRYNLKTGNELGDWIIKTPSTQHKFVPLNEFSSMTLAALAGVNIPDIRLVELNKLDNLPPINLPDEKYAFAIKRFDRENNIRVHMEDFAQVLMKYPEKKYNSANYQQIGKILFLYSGDGLADAQQFARRLLVNILLGNGDAHLKNWSLLYPDQITPRLSPAYDIVSTMVYIEGENQFALNLDNNKYWFQADLSDFERWAEKSSIPWRAVKPHLHDVIEKARSLWPKALQTLPMNEDHKLKLKQHWQKLQPCFKI